MANKKKADTTFDRKMGVKEGSAKDKKIDRLVGVKDKGKKGYAKNWIQAAHLKEGTFSKKAKNAGMSTQAYASKVTGKDSKADATTKKQANLAKTFSQMSKKK